MSEGLGPGLLPLLTLEPPPGASQGTFRLPGFLARWGAPSTNPCRSGEKWPLDPVPMQRGHRAADQDAGRGPRERTTPGLPGAGDWAGQAARPTEGRITVRCVVSGLAKLQPQALSKGQMKRDFSQPVNKGRITPSLTRLGIMWGWGGSPWGGRRAPARRHPAHPGRHTAPSCLWEGRGLVQKQERGPQRQAGGLTEGPRDSGGGRGAQGGRGHAHRRSDPNARLAVQRAPPNPTTKRPSLTKT